VPLQLLGLEKTDKFELLGTLSKVVLILLREEIVASECFEEAVVGLIKDCFRNISNESPKCCSVSPTMRNGEEYESIGGLIRRKEGAIMIRSYDYSLYKLR
jgi:hypothetical protein